jgi:hypothetical protein
VDALIEIATSKEGDRSAQHGRLRDVEDRVPTILPQVLACPIQVRAAQALFSQKRIASS